MDDDKLNDTPFDTLNQVLSGTYLYDTYKSPCKYTSIGSAHLVYQVACFGTPDIFQNSKFYTTCIYNYVGHVPKHNLVLHQEQSQLTSQQDDKTTGNDDVDDNHHCDHDVPSESDCGRLHRRRSKSSSRSSLTNPEQDDSTATRSPRGNNNTAATGSFLLHEYCVELVGWVFVYH